VSQNVAPKVLSKDDQSVHEIPYGGFHQDFREVVAVHHIEETKAHLHVVFGSIADIQNMPVAIPVGQSFDFLQRGPRSVLASFEDMRIGRSLFFDYIDATWPVVQRPRAAGLGHTKYIPLPKNAHNLPGALFVVTTRDLSGKSEHYGYFVNTPIEGIDIILDGVVHVARSQQFKSIALPLVGTGYANIRRTTNQRELRCLLEQAVVLLTIQKLLEALGDKASTLRRAVIVIYSGSPQGQDEHDLWQVVTRFFGSTNKERENQLRTLVQDAAKI
jgi:hypothetical protein